MLAMALADYIFLHVELVLKTWSLLKKCQALMSYHTSVKAQVGLQVHLKSQLWNALRAVLVPFTVLLAKLLDLQLLLYAALYVLVSRQLDLHEAWFAT